MKSAIFNPIKRYYMWILTHITVLIMGSVLYINPTAHKIVTIYSGYITVFWLVIVLSLNPLKFIFPQLIILKKLNHHRQEFGVASFSHALIHLICFIIKRGSLENTFPWLLHPAVLPGALIAFPILLLLALTSNNISIKTLGFTSWKKLHKTIYIAEGAVIIHMVLMGHGLYASLLFVPLLSFQLIRKKGNYKRSNILP